jgi:NCS1 family nucleobase:cation symporter-1
VLTFGQTLRAVWSPGARARTVTCIVLGAAALSAALLSKDSFLANYEDFILLLLYVLVPWTAINLVDYYLLRHGEYDVAAFMQPDGGMYGRINIPAVGCYLFGIVLQFPFVASPLYTGPIARAIGGIDLSWIVGLVVTSPVYYWLGKRSQARRGVRLAPTAELPT